MMYLIIKETDYENMENTYRVVDTTSDIDKANNMLQGYNLINQEDNVVYSIVKYEQPQIQKEVAWLKKENNT